MAKSFWRDERGNFTIIAALATPVIMLLAAGALDIARYNGVKEDLQSIVDHGAIAGAKEMTLANVNADSIRASVENAVSSRVSGTFDGYSFTKSVEVDTDNMEVRVSVVLEIEGLLAQNLFPQNGKVRASSKGAATGATKLCAISLSTANNRALSFDDRATLNAEDCSLYANSTETEAVYAGMRTGIIADVVCSAGGVRNNSSNFDAEAITDCPPIPDPLQNRAQPTDPGYCDEIDFELGAGVQGVVDNVGHGLGTDLVNDALEALYLQYRVALEPGVYCGGMRLRTLASVELEPGIYIIKDGPLEIDARAWVKGEGVHFFFTGTNAVIDFGVNSIIDLSAQTSGPMAGILFMEDRNNPAGQQHTISSSLARKLLGTIYFPKGTFLVDSTRPVAQESAYTVVIADKVQLEGQPSLFLNTDYAGSSVPVPKGVGPINGTAYLRQ